MAPLRLLSSNFILSLSKNTSEPSNKTTDVKAETSEENGELTSSGFDEEEFDDDSQEFLDRKELLVKMEAAKNVQQFSREAVVSKGNFEISLL